MPGLAALVLHASRKMAVVTPHLIPSPSARLFEMGSGLSCRSCQKPERYDGMADNYKDVGSNIAGLGASVFMAWLGSSQLYRWYTTGELLASFRGMDNLTKWQFVTL
jgi:hypothetical protein